MQKEPSKYLVDHVRLTSQPIERPESNQHLINILEAMDAERLLMFSSDYPHWDFDSPTHAFPRLSPELRSRIFKENARQFYGLGSET